KMELQDVSSEPLKADEIRIQTIYSGISRGTEMTVYRGTSPLFNKLYDSDIKLFLKSDLASFTYPLEFGYENIGRIVEAGPEVSGYAVGDIVFSPMQHTEYLNLSTTESSVFFGDLVPILKMPRQIKPEFSSCVLSSQLRAGGPQNLRSPGGIRIKLISLQRGPRTSSVGSFQNPLPERRCLKHYQPFIGGVL
ncbi:hypothetical protein LCGC14_1264310, partial [marine sediment metagenome]